MAGIWVNEKDYVEFSEDVDRTALMSDIATRSRSWDWQGQMDILPDPDPVLRKLNDGGVKVLENLTADGHLCSVIQSRKLGTLKKEFKWHPGTINDEKPSAAAEKLAQNLTRDLERVDLYNLVSGILDAPFFGMSPVELSWKPGTRNGTGWLNISNLQVKPSRWFGFDEFNQPKFLSMDNPWSGEALPFGKFVFPRHFPTYDNPYGLRLLSRCFWPVAFKKGGWKFWVTLCEKYGIPFIVGEYPRGASGTEQTNMLSNLAAMVQDAVAVIPSGGSVKILETGNAGSGGGSHQAMITAANAEISKVIMLQTQTVEITGTGTQASATVHADVLEDCQEADQTLVKTVMEEIAWVYGQINAPGVPTPDFSWFEEDDPKTDMAERDKTLCEADGRFKPTKSYYMRQYNYQEDDFDLVETVNDASSLPKKRDDTEFSEDAADAMKFTDDQQVLEDFASSLTDGNDTLSANEAKIKKAIEKSQSFEEAMEALLDLYPELDVDELAGMLERSIVNTELFGMATAKNETG